MENTDFFHVQSGSRGRWKEVRSRKKKTGMEGGRGMTKGKGEAGDDGVRPLHLQIDHMRGVRVIRTKVINLPGD